MLQEYEGFKRVKCEMPFRTELYDVSFHKFARLLAAQGGMGWVPESVKRKCEVIRQWKI